MCRVLDLSMGEKVPHAPGVSRGKADPWMEHMRKGEFEKAWQVSDGILRNRIAGAPCHHLPRHLQHVWDGTPLQGRRVLVRCYHGLGDTIQFIRYAPLVRAVAARLIVWMQPRLIPLFAGSEWIDELLRLHDGAPEAEYDVDVEIMELPHVFRTTLASMPADVPYIHVPTVELPAGRGVRVGIVWSGGEWDVRRSIPFDIVRRLKNIANVTWYIFQHGRQAKEQGSELGHVVTAGIVEEAGMMRSLDLMISVDTLAVHLAGALGIPTWTLLPAEADWRWMDGREESPWYPTMRLFRQRRDGGWAPVIARVASELARIAADAWRENRDDLSRAASMALVHE